MKKGICITLCVLLICLLTVPALAVTEEPVITLEPQSPNYPQYSVASYTCKVTGTNLRATWYLQWQGQTYNLSDNTNSMEPWEAYAGESYGGMEEEGTFTFFFSGIACDLDGASIWCEVEDGHYLVESQKARISVGNENNPPVITDIPARMTAEQGTKAEIRCVALAPGDTQLSYIWYETSTGLLQDIQAIDRGAEDRDVLLCDTSSLGTRYYVCCVETSAGGRAYSSIVPVTVVEATQEPTEETSEATEATQETTVPTEETEATETTEVTELTEATEASEPTQAPTEPLPTDPLPPQKNGMPWWTLLLVGVAAAAVGVGITLVLLRKKK